MAFDMYFDDSRECIDHHEEFLFHLVQSDDERYPELLRLWEAFYDGPRISSTAAGALVHELLELVSAHGGASNQPLTSIAVRLSVFFSKAYRSGVEVRCVSD